MIKLKDKIIDILMEELCEVNCDSCDAEYCEDGYLVPINNPNLIKINE